ncbi:hypothetical protein [Paraferrimonas sedimenticola]|uniref:Uncharacterized protein n=1 Tax=Paraferrimonas sedimenticola TaxID=375674 RepID=A0AA37S086_9GAMM|nr:hypothetical protein [Paraferrimonas sedimenticola]GLP98137.1 hypothetical protein GCM10007895_34440 [Paraferrimonas sedimenticola]
MSEPLYWFQRLTKTALRALHILGICGVGGGVLFNLESSVFQDYWLMTIATGSILMGWEVLRSPVWLAQLKGVLTLVKLGLLALFLPFPEYQGELFIAILLLSVLVTHGPSGLRHFSIVHMRKISSKGEIKG